MEPKEDGNNKFSKISIHWVKKPEGFDEGNSPFSDPEFLRALSEALNHIGDNLGDEEFDLQNNTDDEHMSPLQLKLDNLEDIDNMVAGDEHPVALRLIMDAVSRVRDGQ